MQPLVIVPELASRIAAAQAELDAMRPLSDEVMVALRHAVDVDLTHTSNAVEGSTLSAGETALVIEKGITVGGKTLREHLEAQDHYAAIGWIRSITDPAQPIGEAEVRELHRRIVLRSAPEIAGVYARLPRRVAGSLVVFPSAEKVPGLMRQFGSWLATESASAVTAFDAHLRLVTIHPFADGNGRTARLLMNLVLMRAGLTPITIRAVDRAAYLSALEAAQADGSVDSYTNLLSRRLAETLEDWVGVCREAVSSRAEQE